VSYRKRWRAILLAQGQSRTVVRDTARCLISDRKVRSSWCKLYRKGCMGSFCSVTPTPERCQYRIRRIPSV